MRYKITLDKQGEKTIEIHSVQEYKALIEILEQCYNDKVLNIEKLHNTNSNKCWCNPTIIKPERKGNIG